MDLDIPLSRSNSRKYQRGVSLIPQQPITMNEINTEEDAILLAMISSSINI